MNKRLEIGLLSGAFLIALSTLGLRWESRSDDPRGLIDHAKAHSLAEEPVTGPPDFIVSISPGCEGCGLFWEKILQYEEMGLPGSPNISVHVLPDADGPNTMAMAFECAGIEGRTLEYAAAALGHLDTGPDRTIGIRAGLANIPDHDSCVRRARKQYALDRRVRELAELGVSSLPHIRVLRGSETLSFAPEQFLVLLESMLAGEEWQSNEE